MASSSSQSGQRRKPLKKRQPLTRANSSLLGTIKNLVTAPLAWFASTDDFEDSKDLKGKRRRLAAAPTEPAVEEDDRSSRNKRLRVHSPPRDHQPMQQPPSGDAYGYLDPPGSAFQQPSIFNQLNPTRSASEFTPAPTYDFPHNNSNFMRANTLSRTMSIDPPSRPVSRSSALASIPMPINRDTSVDSSMNSLSLRRDLSMPPLSGRPSFRMRASMTPVPQTHREVSEPPPINTLVSNPMFIRGPPQIESHQRSLSRQPSVTLGSLVESVRSTRSPSRQHSSLFGSNPEPISHNMPRQESPAEKALHELDIYKTPLVPTRLRSSNPPTGNTSSVDLFKSRRGAHLILMQDDKRINRLGRKVSGKSEAPLVNETKPYAGEGGMKKLLARRKMELEDNEDGKETKFEDDVEQRVQHNGDEMEDGEREADTQLNGTSESIPPPLPPPSKADWFSAASSSSTSIPSSSLRVGRTKRAHIARPTTRPMKTKFSAAYEDDDPMDDGEGDQEEERRKERAMLDEAAKRAPLFEIPKDFTFAKVAELVQHDTTGAKEPPIVALPFSFSKTAPAPKEPAPSTVSAGVTPSQPPPVDSESMTSPVTLTPPAKSTNGSRVPNFFATSSSFTKPLDVPQPSPLAFPVSLSPAVTQPEPVKDVENPLWEGESEKKTTETPAPGSGLFSAFGAIKSETAPSNLFGNSAPLVLAPPLTTPTSEPPSATSIPNFFGTNTKKDDTPPVGQGSLFSVPPAQGFSFSQPSSTLSSTFGGETPKPAPLFGTEATVPSFNTETPKPTSLFGNDAPKVTAPQLSFSFSQPTVPTAPTVEIPKSLFAGAVSAGPVDPPKSNFDGAFSFSVNKEKEPKPAITPFSFGVPPSTPPPVEPKKDVPFSFGPAASTSAPPLSAPAPISFSFSNSSSTSDTESKSFSFGTPTVIAQTDRPSTPPKNQDQECSMEESPTRDVQAVNGMNKPPERPTLGFSFGSNVPASIFGNQSNGSAPASSSSFSFNTASSSSNPFAKDNKPDENKPFGGFGQTLNVPSSTPGFTFGQSKPADNNDSVRPSTPASFGFGGPAPSSATGPGSTFAFGGPGNNSTGSAFGQATQPSSSAPSSPSTFSQPPQPSPFSFTAAPLPSVNTAFSFGSQPASPAGGNSALSLPQPATPSGFGAGGFGQPQPSSPFGAPAPSAPAPSGGGTLFTIGAAPSAPAGARTIRKLPIRRGGAKR